MHMMACVTPFCLRKYSNSLIQIYIVSLSAEKGNEDRVDRGRRGDMSCGVYVLSSRKCIIQIRISDLFLEISLLLSKSANTAGE